MELYKVLCFYTEVKLVLRAKLLVNSSCVSDILKTACVGARLDKIKYKCTSVMKERNRLFSKW